MSPLQRYYPESYPEVGEKRGGEESVVPGVSRALFFANRPRNRSNTVLRVVPVLYGRVILNINQDRISGLWA